MYLSRTVEPFIAAAGNQFPALLVTGPRQVGKTTLLKHLAGDARTYVTLDDPLLAMLARDDPALFLERFPPPVLIDEIQYAPQLLPHIKMAADRVPAVPSHARGQRNPGRSGGHRPSARPVPAGTHRRRPGCPDFSS